MPRIELIIDALRETGRIERIKLHPHNLGCNGKGIIETIAIALDSVSGPSADTLGRITRCTSCGYVQKTGTLSDKEIPEGGGSYYF